MNVTENDRVEIWKTAEKTREGFQGWVSDGERVTEMIGDGEKHVAD